MKKTKDSTNKKVYSNCEKYCPECGHLMIIEKTITPKAEINEYLCKYCGRHENIINEKISQKEKELIELIRHQAEQMQQAQQTPQSTYDTLIYPQETTITSTSGNWVYIDGTPQYRPNETH